jgi:lycopene beta-cyclase
VISTGGGTLVSGWVFDSAPGLAPEFPASRGPRALLSGPGLRVFSNRPVFDAATATLFDPLDERSFAYLLPLGPAEALVESASFGPRPVKESPEPLLGYLRERYPAARFEVLSAEYGSIPLGFAPERPPDPGTSFWEPSAGSSSPAPATA